MTTLNLRYFVARPSVRGPRHYWQPSAELRAEGWRAATLARDKPTAWGQADAINADLDRWYRTRQRAEPGTVAALVDSYKASRLWARLAPKSRADYAKHLGVIARWFGASPVLAITPGQVQREYEALAQRAPARAADIVGMVRVLFDFAINNDKALVNPAARPQITRPARTQPVIWSSEAVSAMIAAADATARPSVGDAIAYGHWLGHYPGDLVKLTRANYRDGVFSFTRTKTGAGVVVPHNALTGARARGALVRHMARGTPSPYLLVCEATSQPYASGEALAKVYRKVRAVADKQDSDGLQLGRLRFKWLRHTAVVRLAEAACTLPEIASITGHSLAGVHRILDWYFDPTDTIARAAVAKRLAFEGETT